MLGFRKNILLKLNIWQNYRLFWLIITIITCCFNLVAFYYQIILGQPPCEYCVYQRLAIFTIILGCVVAAVKPRCLYVKQTGLLVATIGSLYGLYSVIKQLYSQFNHDSLFVACSLKPKFPFNLPLDEWLPLVFKVHNDCHATSPTFLGVPFSYWLLLIFIGYSIFCAYLWWLKNKKLSKNAVKPYRI